MSDPQQRSNRGIAQFRMGRDVDPEAWQADKFDFPDAATFNYWRNRRIESLRKAEAGEE